MYEVALLFYLSMFCMLAFFFGTCAKLYTKSFNRNKIEVNIQESTKYTPTYK